MTAKILLTGAALFVGATAMAMPAAADQIDRRQSKQAHRIEQGIKSGQLTRFEAAKLKVQQAYIRSLERRAKADGHLSPAERARIAAAQKKAGRAIRAEKHDGQKRRFGFVSRKYRWF